MEGPITQELSLDHDHDRDEEPEAGGSGKAVIAVIVAIAVLAFTTRRARLVSLPLAWGLVGLVVFQGLLGMLTVTWQVTPLIVTAHLIFGRRTSRG